MPLREHFYEPLKSFCPWRSFHAMWGAKMVERLNESLLSDRFMAQTERAATEVEIDVATLERHDPALPYASSNGHESGVAIETQVYAPPAPPLTGPIEFSSSELFEVKVYRGGGGWNLVAAVELVSEANKDRKESRPFAIKCASYLQSGVSVVVIDAVSSRNAELHDDLCDLLEVDDGLRWTSPTGLAATAYRVVRHDRLVRLDAWPHPLVLGKALPTVPLWLAADYAVPLELEMTYEAACKSLRIR